MFERYRQPKNPWNNRGPPIPILEAKSYSRSNDLTFSVGRKIDYNEVHDLLISAGCFAKGELHEYINQMRITGNLENGQVFLECSAPGINDEFVEKLKMLTLSDGAIRKCHSYSNKELLVRFSFIHSSVNIQTDIVEKFLLKYGEVLDWWPIKDKVLNIPTGPYIFVMKEEQIKRNPLPESVFLNNVQVFINHRNQLKLCHSCGKPGHYKRECTNNNFPAAKQSVWF